MAHTDATHPSVPRPYAPDRAHLHRERRRQRRVDRHAMRAYLAHTDPRDPDPRTPDLILPRWRWDPYTLPSW